MIQRRILVEILVTLLALPTLSGGAQTPAAGPMPAEDELPGLVSSVWRSYPPEGTFEGSAVIKIDAATPISSVAGTTQIRSIDVFVREFDTAENAAAAFGEISTVGEGWVDAMFADGTEEVTSEDLPDIGSQARLTRIDHTGQGSHFWLEHVVVQHDEYVFHVAANGSVWDALPGSDEVDRTLPTVEIAASISAGEPSSEEPVFNDDGTSTGGLWELMPSAGDPLLMGLVPSQDHILYPYPST